MYPLLSYPSPMRSVKELANYCLTDGGVTGSTPACVAGISNIYRSAPSSVTCVFLQDPVCYYAVLWDHFSVSFFMDHGFFFVCQDPLIIYSLGDLLNVI